MSAELPSCLLLPPQQQQQQQQPFYRCVLFSHMTRRRFCRPLLSAESVALQLLPQPGPGLDPEQLQLLEGAFASCDEDRDGALSSTELRALLRGLGMEPTTRDVQALMQELALPNTGARFKGVERRLLLLRSACQLCTMRCMRQG